MPCKKSTFFLCAFILSGCSVVAYTPVIATSALGLNKTDLTNEPEFKMFIRQPFTLAPIDNLSWQLKKFEGGRYHIELESSLSKKVVICELGSESVVIEEIFDDSINGGVFYSAKVDCNDHIFNAPLNNWSEQLKNSIAFTEENTQQVNQLDSKQRAIETRF